MTPAHYQLYFSVSPDILTCRLLHYLADVLVMYMEPTKSLFSYTLSLSQAWNEYTNSPYMFFKLEYAVDLVSDFTVLQFPDD